MAPPPAEARAVAEGAGAGVAGAWCGDVRVARVHEGAADAARPAVEVLVVAPRGEVDVPGVQGERDVADGVREVPTDGYAARLGVRGDGGDVEELAAVVLDAREEEQGSGGGVLVDDGEDVGGGQVRGCGVGRVELDEGGGGVQVVVVELGLYGVLARWVSARWAGFEEV